MPATKNDAPVPRRKRGLVRRIFRCLIILMVLCALLLFASWRSITRWDERATPWRNLPPGTQWAAHVHDIAAVGATLVRDRGVRSMLSKTAGDDKSLGDPFGWRNHIPLGAVQGYRRLGFLHKALLPNSAVVGATFRAPNEPFAILLPPPAIRTLLHWSGERFKTIRSTTLFDEAEIFYIEHNGWIVASYFRSAIQEVLDGWEKGTFPLGAGSETFSPHAYFAARSEADKTEQTNTPSEFPPASHFTFADPFATLPSPEKKETARESAPAFRLMLTPGSGAWHIAGEVKNNGTWNGGDSLTGAMARLKGAEPKARTPSGRDVAVFAVLDQEIRAGLQSSVEHFTETRDPAHTHPIRALFARWLSEGWLNRAGNKWVVTAGKPVLNQDSHPYPLLPVVSIGWTLREGTSAIRGGMVFGRELDRVISAIRTPGGVLALQSLRQAVEHRWNGREGRVVIPPVAVNAARPAWRFCQQSGGTMGWLSTDPSGLPDEKGEEAERLGAMLQPDTGRATVDGSWNFSDGFIHSVHVWGRDRLEIMKNAGIVEKDRADEITGLVTEALRLAHCFPKGAIVADVGKEGGVFSVRVPGGVRVPLKVQSE